MAAIRRMVYAAPALVLVIFCASAAWGIYQREFSSPEDFSSGNEDRVFYSLDQGGLVLCNAFNCIPYIWVPSRDESVISKLDARSGTEIGRYKIGPRGSNWIAAGRYV